LQAMANQLDGEYPAPTYMNGNDVLALIKTTDGNVPNASFTNVIPVDLFGQIGLGAAISAETGWSPVKDSTLSYKNSGGDVITGKVINYIVQAKSATVNGVSSNAQFGPFWMSWTSDHTLIRKVSIVKGVTTSPIPFKVNMEWDTAHAVLDSAGHWNYKDIWTNLGKHDCRADPFLSVDKSSPAAGVSIYPNPVTDGHFTISSQTAVKEIEIFSILGQSVHRQTAKKGQQQQIEIGPVKLEKGLYMVRVTSSSNITTVKKIIVR